MCVCVSVFSILCVPPFLAAVSAVSSVSWAVHVAAAILAPSVCPVCVFDARGFLVSTFDLISYFLNIASCQFGIGCQCCQP